MPWTGPAGFFLEGPPPESITFAPIANIDGFLGISAGPVAFSEGVAWQLLIDLNGTWQAIFTGNVDSSGLDAIPPASFAAGTVSGIEFSGPYVSFEGMSGSVFSFDQVATVPEPAGLPIFATALAALGVCLRRAGIRRR